MFSAIRPVLTDDGGVQYTGFDRFGRIIDQRWTKSGTDKDRILYTYDENSNRLTRDVSMAGSGSSDNFDEKYTYDSLNQLTAFDRGVLSGGKISSPIFGQSWNPDALGNFESVTNTTYGSSTITENRDHNGQNQLLSLTITGSSTTTLSFDNAGSMNQSVFAEQGKSAVTTTFTLDAWNRTINFKGSGRYAYDPLNRRIKEDTKALFYSNNWQVLEERTSGVVSFRYAWSPVYVDAMIARDEYTYDSKQSKYVVSERLYAATDANYNVTALINTSGGVDERFGYDPYGAVKLLDNTWGSVSISANGWVYLHQDGRLDEATGMYHFRNRDADADLMRWNRVDPIGFRAGDTVLYRYAANQPTNVNDALGLCISIALCPQAGPAIIEGVYGANALLGGASAIALGGGIGAHIGNIWNLVQQGKLNGDGVAARLGGILTSKTAAATAIDVAAVTTIVVAINVFEVWLCFQNFFNEIAKCKSLHRVGSDDFRICADLALYSFKICLRIAESMDAP